MRRPNRLAAAAAFCLAVTNVPAVCAQGAKRGGEGRFIPEAHYPSPAILYISVEDVAELRGHLERTLPGRIVTHPGWARAFARLRRSLGQRLGELDAGIRAVTGKGPRELLDLFRGGISLCVRRVVPPAIIEAALAIELGDSREEILGVVSRIQSFYRRTAGVDVERRHVGGVDATVWPAPTGPVFQTVMGTHLLFVTSPDLLRDIRNIFDGSAGIPPLEESTFLRELSAPLEVPDRQVVAALNLEALRPLVFPMIGFSPEAAEIRQVIRVTGLGRLTSVGWALGFRDGAATFAGHLGMRSGASGVFEAIQTGLLPVGPVEEALGKVPASAAEVRAGRVAPGRIARNLNRLVREKIPELGGDLDSFFGRLEEETGISVETDLFALDDVTVVSFDVEPPAGSFVPDTLHFIRSAEFAPYWSLAAKAAAAAGGRVRTLDAGGGEVEYLGFRIREADGLSWVPSRAEVATLAFLAGGLARGGSLARWETPDGWTVVSTYPQAVVRYAEYYRKEDTLAGDQGFAGFAKRKLSGAAMAAAFRGERSALLSTYNTVLSLASGLSPLLAQYGVDLAAAPPAEVFLEETGPGWFTFESKPGGFTIRGHRVGGSTGTLGLVAGAGVVAGLAVPPLMEARKKAAEIRCLNNLRVLQQTAYFYARAKGRFPHDDAGSAASFRLLLGSTAGEDLEPETFVCPEEEQQIARVVDGRFVLEDASLSYEVVPWPLGANDRGLLFFDRRPRHGGKRAVVETTGKAMTMSEAEFQRRFSEERKRFGRDDGKER